MNFFGYITMIDPPEEVEEKCPECGDEDWYCEECFDEIVSIGDID